MGRRHRTIPARCARARRRSTRPATTVAVFAGAFRSWHGAVNLVARAARAARARPLGHRRRVRRRRAGAARRVQAKPPTSPNVVFTGAVPHERDAGVPRRRRHRRRAVRHRRAPPAVARLLLVAAEDLRVHGGRPAGGRARCRPDPVSSSPTAAKDCSTTLRDHGALAGALETLSDPALRLPLGPRRPRARRPRLQLGGALRGARRRAIRGETRSSRVTRLLLRHRLRFRRSAAAAAGAPTSSRAVSARAATHVIVVQPQARRHRPDVREREYDGLRVLEFGVPAPPLPYVRNYFKNERLYPALTDVLVRHHRARADRSRPRPARDDRPARRSTPRTVTAVPAVCTVRDYWPVCYWSDLIYTREWHVALPRVLGGE